jgi:hypothetical protein
MPPEKYALLSGNPMAGETSTVFVGLVVRGVLDVKVLEQKAKDLIAKWPVLGGKLVMKAYRFKKHPLITN